MIDRIGMALEANLRIDRIVLANGWKYFNVESVARTDTPGVYVIHYAYRGEPLRTVIAASEVATVTPKQEEATL